MKQFWYLAAILLGMLSISMPLPAQEPESHPDTGIIYGQQYVNSYFGFSYRFPAGWSGNAARLTMASQVYPLFSASSPGGGSGSYIAIQAEHLWQGGNVKTGKDFLAMSVGMLTGPSSGFEALPGDKHYILSDKEFDRVDLRSKSAPGSAMVRQALVCTVLRNYAVTFQFKAANDNELEELVGTMLSLSFLDSSQSSTAATATSVTTQPPPVVPAPAVSAPAAAAAVPSRVPSQSAVTLPTTAQVPAPSTARTQSAGQMSPDAVPTRTESTVTASAGGAVPSALIKMTSPPHTLVGETLPPVQPIEPVSQPLVKAEAKPDATKTAVLQAVMPAPSAELSPMAVNTNPQPPAPVHKPTEAPVKKTTEAAVNNISVIPPAMKTEITRVQIPAATLESYVTRKVPAVYPLTARQSRIEGLVVLNIVVDDKGNVQEVTALSGPAVLARSAEDALRHWRFNPIIVNGKPTQIESRISMNFQLPH